MEKIVLIGAGGHCKSIIDSIENSNLYEIVGILDGNKIGDTVLGYKVIGDDSLIYKLYDMGIKNAFICMAGDNRGKLREKIHHKLKEKGFIFPIICDPSANVSKHSKIGEGTFIGKSVIINADVTIGIQNIINTRAIVEHDTYIGDFSHIAPGSILCGGVIIEGNTLIGANSTVIPSIKVAKNVVIGAGSVVIKNINEGNIIIGNPGREK